MPLSTASSAARPRRKRRNQYHHGDLSRALLDEALRTIRESGMESLTLRAIGQSLGVSRTALYRHFADKHALLAAVATEGFRMLREQLAAAWNTGGRDIRGFNEMGTAYVAFATANPSHYRVMFGRFDSAAACDEHLTTEAAAAFQVLVDSLVALQQAGLVRPDDPARLAHFIWAAVHGISMLIIDGQLAREAARIDELIQFAIDRLHTGIRPETGPAGSSRSAV